MKNLSQKQIPFKKEFTPSKKTQHYNIDVDFVSTGVIRGDEIEVGMLINKGSYSRIHEVLEKELVKGRLELKSHRHWKFFSDLDEEWITWEVAGKQELKL